MRAGLNGNAGQGLLGRGGEGLGQREMRRIGSDNFVALSRGCVVQGLGKTLVGFRHQGDLGSVDLIGCRRAGHGRAGGGVALVPIHCAGVGRCATQINCGVQRHTLDRGINRGGHAGNRRLGDSDGCGGNVIFLCEVGIIRSICYFYFFQVHCLRSNSTFLHSAGEGQHCQIR